MPVKIDTPAFAPIFLETTSSQFAVRNLLADLISILKDRGFSPEALSNVEILLAEALNNVMEHACREESGIPFSLHIDMNGPQLTAEITDLGVAMPGQTLPISATGGSQQPAVDVPRNDLPESGWGWFIISDLADEYSYERDENTNRLLIKMTPEKS